MLNNERIAWGLGEGNYGAGFLGLRSVGFMLLGSERFGEGGTQRAFVGAMVFCCFFSKREDEDIGMKIEVTLRDLAFLCTVRINIFMYV